MSFGELGATFIRDVLSLLEQDTFPNVRSLPQDSEYASVLAVFRNDLGSS